MKDIDNAYQATKPQSPKWSIQTRTDFGSSTGLTSWAKSVPGPKYTYDTNQLKPRQPVFSIQGTAKKTQTRSKSPDEGPAWLSPAQLSCIEQKHPTMPHSPVCSFSKLPRPSPNPNKDAFLRGLDPGARNAQKLLGKGPAITMHSRDMWKEPHERPNRRPTTAPADPCQGDVGCGNGKLYDPKGIFRRGAETPLKFSIGKRLPTEGQSTRSPGPIHYYGAAVDMKKLERVDSTRKCTASPSFGVGPRWEGPVCDMARSGALTRYQEVRFVLSDLSHNAANGA